MKPTIDKFNKIKDGIIERLNKLNYEERLKNLNHNDESEVIYITDNQLYDLISQHKQMILEQDEQKK